MVQELLNSNINIEAIEEIYKKNEDLYTFTYDFNISEVETKEFLEQFKRDFSQDKFNKLITDCKKEVITSIVIPFGLGKVFSAYDKTGGNVDTIHNAREGIYVTKEAKDNYESRGEYDSHKYHHHTEYIKNNKDYSNQRKNGEAIDYMTGERLDSNKSHDLDHVVSAKEIHDDRGRVLANIDGADLANTEVNLKPTSATRNRSKKADPLENFIEQKNKRIEKIDELKSKSNKTKQEENELRKLEEFSKIDDEKALIADREARNAQNKEIDSTYYTSREFVKNTAVTGFKEGAAMGIQQALGLIIVEFFTALFDEILDIYQKGFNKGFDNDKFFNVLKERLKRIAKRLQEKWKDIAIAFKDGAISGFISNLVTTVINMFITTAKRVVRIIREGMFSLIRAVKLLLFPPKGMSSEQAMHEAKKLILSGIIISLGVLAEEYIDKMVRCTVFLEPFADVLTSIFVGAITGISVTMAVYYIDKKKNDKELVEALLSNTNKKIENAEELLKLLQYTV